MLAQQVIHDPNSPLRNDEFYIPVMQAVLHERIHRRGVGRTVGDQGHPPGIGLDHLRGIGLADEQGIGEIEAIPIVPAQVVELLLGARGAPARSPGGTHGAATRRPSAAAENGVRRRKRRRGPGPGLARYGT